MAGSHPLAKPAVVRQGPQVFVIDEWGDYVKAVLPILPDIIEAYRTRELRRVRFTNYMKRDRALDTICKRITGSQEYTLVAFGAANSCSTGFGLARWARLV